MKNIERSLDLRPWMTGRGGCMMTKKATLRDRVHTPIWKGQGHRSKVARLKNVISEVSAGWITQSQFVTTPDVMWRHGMTSQHDVRPKWGHLSESLTVMEATAFLKQMIQIEDLINKGVPIWHFCRYADIGDCRYADIADIFQIQMHRKRSGFGFRFKSGFKIFWFRSHPLLIYIMYWWYIINHPCLLNEEDLVIITWL